MNESDYMQLRNKSLAYASEARTLQDRIAEVSATPPPGEAETVETLKGAIENLASAARNLNRFFNAENGDQERELAAGLRNSLKSAGTALEKVQSRLGGTTPVIAP